MQLLPDFSCNPGSFPGQTDNLNRRPEATEVPLPDPSGATSRYTPRLSPQPETLHGGPPAPCWGPQQRTWYSHFHWNGTASLRRNAMILVKYM